jgi:transcriptional regulator with XRE-family HTH domain
MINPKEMGERMRQIRERLGLTKSAFAQKIGVAHSSIVGYENGDHMRAFETLAKILEIGEVSINWLYFGVDSHDSLTKDETDLLYHFKNLGIPAGQPCVEQ